MQRANPVPLREFGRVDAEVVSTFNYEDVERLCRKSTVFAHCDRCGAVTRDGAHLGIAFYGIFCARCCFACTGEFTLTLAEFGRIRENRGAAWAGVAGRNLTAGATNGDGGCRK